MLLQLGQTFFIHTNLWIPLRSTSVLHNRHTRCIFTHLPNWTHHDRLGRIAAFSTWPKIRLRWCVQRKFLGQWATTNHFRTSRFPTYFTPHKEPVPWRINKTASSSACMRGLRDDGIFVQNKSTRYRLYAAAFFKIFSNYILREEDAREKNYFDIKTII